MGEAAKHRVELDLDEDEADAEKVVPEPAPAAARAGEPPREVHYYDGIEEQDNDMPRWWLWTLYGTLVFAAGYWLWHSGFHASPTLHEAYEAEMAEAAAAEAAKLRTMGEVTAPGLLALSRDEETLGQGRATFEQSCSACHGVAGGGAIGPNLTDDHWIHGAGVDAQYRVVRDGVTQKGMPAWGAQLGEERVRAVTAFLVTLRGTNVPGGKPPQGEPAR